ncbi:hypothetical protein [Streptomyces caniscabiei]|uniref:hypothetical protein n=1 Tax=Streptomyces caniscabiei TaxID=2746961 RepID=UPI0018725C0D|nr:hypothetical protein [Streptomyces caniscabiei]MBE4761705.1 hypothetical protein [Streptomyces caniscabiei]MDX2947949.1 hypothetical protein [Streptomyces caniscabiei]MDX2986414.1 hypothetical protein [Streptomyces caniscabiei]
MALKAAVQPADHDVDDWLDALDKNPDLRLRDLKGQGVPTIDLYTMTDIEPAGDYL